MSATAYARTCQTRLYTDSRIPVVLYKPADSTTDTPALEADIDENRRPEPLTPAAAAAAPGRRTKTAGFGHGREAAAAVAAVPALRAAAGKALASPDPTAPIMV